MFSIVIVTGVSGAGKTSCLSAFEESGYYVVDNIPFNVAEKLFETFLAKPERYSKVAIAVNLGIALKVYQLAKTYKEFIVDFLGLDCSNEILSERFRLSRRLHPLQAMGYTLEQAMKKDSKDILDIREEFTLYLDTSKIAPNELRRFIYLNLIHENGNEFTVTFVSFGYKKMVPQDIETVFDVRILPNPYWVPELRELTGKDEKVRDYVLNSDITHEYLEKVTTYLTYYLAKLKEQGRKHAFIGIACSGGQHRSVVIADYLAAYFSKEYSTATNHRDMPK